MTTGELITSSTVLPTAHGQLVATHFHGEDGLECVTFSSPWNAGQPVFVRMHSACLFGEAIGSELCDCRQQLDSSLRLIGAQGGVVVYLPQEGRGMGLGRKIEAMELERSHAFNTVEAFEMLGAESDPRSYDIALAALQFHNVGKRLRLLTNNPKKIAALTSAGYLIERIEAKVALTRSCAAIVVKKQKALGHFVYSQIDYID